jgi:hypothetical protein
VRLRSPGGELSFPQSLQSVLITRLQTVHSDRDAWRSEVERLILIEYRRHERERLPTEKQEPPV